jgi:AcrR family transcriptional regulator
MIIHSFSGEAKMTPPDPIQAQLIAARRNQILDAATRVFADKGFHRSTIHDIAAAAHIADGTIYNYFANKTDLLLGLLDRLNESDQRAEHFAAGAEASFTAFFSAYLRERMTMLWSNIEVFQAVLPELLSNSELRERYFQQVIAPTLRIGETYYQLLSDEGQVRPVDAALAVRVLAGSVIGLLLIQLLGDQELQARWQDLPDVLTTAFLDGLRLVTDDASS